MVSSPAGAATLRGGATWGWDSNVREAMELADHLSDGFLRFSVEAVPEPLRAGRQLLSIRARGLTERYMNYHSESRFQAEGSLDASRRFKSAKTLWLTGRAEHRSYPDSLERNYLRESAAIGFTSPAGKGTLNVSAALRGLDFRKTERFDRTAKAFGADYKIPLHPRLDLNAAFSFEWCRYGRNAIRLVSEDPAENAVTSPQRDRGREARLGLQYIRGWLFETTFGWESVRSNSFGYSVGRRSATAMASGWLPGNLLLQVRGRIESTTYHDSGLSEVFVSPYGENLEAGEDNNSVQARLRRPIGRGWSLEARVSTYRNESLLVGSFYRKSLASVGVVWTPVGTSDF